MLNNRTWRADQFDPTKSKYFIKTIPKVSPNQPKLAVPSL